MKIEYECPSCKQRILLDHPDVVHAGFDDSGFLYCDKNGDLITWSTFDDTYQKLIGQIHPWLLSNDQKRIVEISLKECDCGGKFIYSAPPRCPNCNYPIPNIVKDNLHWVRLKKHIDGTKRNIWK